MQARKQFVMAEDMYQIFRNLRDSSGAYKHRINLDGRLRTIIPFDKVREALGCY